jgi:hypothetical protein
VFQYAAASSDAIKINELMVRPVRRVEAETEPIDGSWLYSALFNMADGPTVVFVTNLVGKNLNPAPYAGMLSFDVSTSVAMPTPVTLPDKPLPITVYSLLPDYTIFPSPATNYPAWQMRSAYDYFDGTNTIAQPLLGESTAWVYAPVITGSNICNSAFPDSWYCTTNETVNPDIMEFRFRASTGLPAGRYYLTVNVTDQYGRMTVEDVDILDYAVKYNNPLDPIAPAGTITDDVRMLLSMMQAADAAGESDIADAFAVLINGLFQKVDEPEYIAGTAAHNLGSACPTGWLFLPTRDTLLEEDGTSYDTDKQQMLYEGFVYGYCDWLAAISTVCPPNPFDYITMATGIPVADDDALYAALMADTTIPPTLFPNVWSLIQDDYIPNSLMPCYTASPGDFPADFLLQVQAMNSIMDAAGLRYFRDETAAFLGPTTGQRTFTVVVPDTAVTGEELCIAFRLNPENAFVTDEFGVPILDALGNPILRSISINFFDFSQEPSHEYVELANVTDEEVDLSGWTLEVGIPDPVGATHDPYMKDPYKSKWTIPTGTRIAPQGKLLLGFDAFDGFQGFGGGGSNLVSNNGMGLAAGTANADLANVTAPAINWMPAVVPPYDIYADDTGSVFQRNMDVDFIDNDGDGFSSAVHILTDANYNLAMDTDNVLEEYRTHGNAAETVPAWARIVQLVNEQLWMDGDTTMYTYPLSANPYVRGQNPVKMDQIIETKTLARLVLRGGALPNYPERDGIDNDGDGGYVTGDKMAQWSSNPPEPLLSYVRGTLDKDMVDNSMNNVIDHCGQEVYAYDVATGARLIGVYTTHGQPLLSEGVDEGHMGTPIWYTDPYIAAPVQSAYNGVWSFNGMRPRMYGMGSPMKRDTCPSGLSTIRHFMRLGLRSPIYLIR